MFTAPRSIPFAVFLGAFEKLQKATISFVMSVRLEQLDSRWTDFYHI
jgi:hypothetical protein